jgi:gliding motility-associated-like protein
MKHLYANRIKLPFLIGLLIISNAFFSQVAVTNNQTVAWYIQNVLLGANVTVSNITYNGSAANANIAQVSVGQFTNPAQQIGLPGGMIMATGNATLAAQTNNGGGVSLGSAGNQPAGNDPQLQTILGSTTTQYDKTIVEFDFVPNGDSLKFSYVFASEEYDEYTCSQFNDVFGFFMSGPNPGGGNYTNFNVARVPNTLTPLTFTSTPVAINTINSGFAGSFGTASECAAIDPNWASYNIYYVSNPSAGPYQYDGRTIALPVAVPVICGQTYHIKLAIADLGDAAFDSGVFLEAGSFASNGVSAADATAPGDVELCTTDLTMDFTGATDPTYNHFWNFGDGVGTSTQPNPSYTFLDTGYYEVMYVASIGSGLCTSSDTVYFDVTLSYPEQFNAQFNIPTIDPCDGVDSLLVSLAFTGTGADSIVWNMGNGDVITDVTSINYYYTTQGIYTISMTAFDLNCGNQQTFTETFDYTTSFSTANAVAPPDTAFCGPPPYNLSFNATSGTPNHFWNFGDGVGTSTQVSPSYTYATPGTYNIMYVAIDSTTCNIADTAYFTVEISQAEVLTADFDFPSIDPCSFPDSVLVSLSFTGTGADVINWNMGNGTTFTNVTNVDYYYTTEGSYTVTMTAFDNHCNTSATYSEVFNYFTTYSEANAEVPEDIFLCTTPLIVDFSAGPNPPPSSFWNFGDGVGTSTQNNPSYTYAAPGVYNVMYVAIDPNTCNIADTAYFTVTLEQAEAFSATLNFTPPPPCGSDSLLVSLAFTGTGADSIIWNMGNGDVFNTNSVNYYYTVPGSYVVSMTAYDNVCDNVQTITNTVNFGGNVVSQATVPNVFTPNGDGENDLLKILSIDGSSEFSMLVFDRWGLKIFESDSSARVWDGKTKSGNESSDGIYYYEVRYTDICTTEEKIKTGFVHLYR